MVEATRSYLELPHFNRETIQNKSKAAAGLCDWAVNIVKYFDVVIDVAPKKAELAEANAKLADANETLEVVMSKVLLLPYTAAAGIQAIPSNCQITWTH